MEKREKRPSRTSKQKVSPPMEEEIQFHQFREILFRFLSRSFSKEPDEQFLQNLPAVSCALKHLVSDLKEDDLLQGSQLLEDFLQETRETAAENILRNLAEQYASLFLGVGPENISLCESAYRNERGLLFQGSYFEVLEEYSKVGLMKQVDFKEPEDHLSVELAFMAHLCRRSVETLRKGKKKETEACYRLQKRFLDDHLDPWVSRFTQGLLDVSPSKLYMAMAHLLRGYVEADRTWVDELLSEIGANKGQPSRKTRKLKKREVKKSVKGKGKD
jgi:TorA-specific chaperone